MVYSMNQIITHSYPKTVNLQKQNYTANISQAPKLSPVPKITKTTFLRPMVASIHNVRPGCSSCGK